MLHDREVHSDTGFDQKILETKNILEHFDNILNCFSTFFPSILNSLIFSNTFNIMKESYFCDRKYYFVKYFLKYFWDTTGWTGAAVVSAGAGGRCSSSSVSRARH